MGFYIECTWGFIWSVRGVLYGVYVGFYIECTWGFQ